MKKRTGKRGESSPRAHVGGLDPEDALLWHRVTETLRPIDNKAKNRAGFETELFSKPAPAPVVKPEKSPTHAGFRPLAKAPTPTGGPAPLNTIEKRLNRRIARGSAGFDARIDLHGMTQIQAHSALLGFLRSSQARGCRVALVITGKGRASDTVNSHSRDHHFGHEAPGVLRRNIRGWLEQQDFRVLVSAYAQAHRRHGGDGAIYVQLRRAK